MRFACVQWDVQFGQVADNAAQAERLLQQTGSQKFDLIVLPEMALSGYCFTGLEEITPFLEFADHGTTLELCQKLARQYQSHVAAGFAESDPAGPFNAMMLVDPAGRVVHVHRKNFLYFTDKTWAKEGGRFACKDVPGLGKCGFGICMDLNPKDFIAPPYWYEFASHLYGPPLKPREKPSTQELQANLVILCNCWLNSDVLNLSSPEERSLELMNYWAGRLTPVLGQPVTVVLANRVGVERGTTFAGTSCVIDLQTRSILGHLSESEEGVLVVET